MHCVHEVFKFHGSTHLIIIGISYILEQSKAMRQISTFREKLSLTDELCTCSFSFVSDHVHFTSPITLNIYKMVHVFMSPSSPLINVICRLGKEMPYIHSIMNFGRLLRCVDILNINIFFLTQSSKGNATPCYKGGHFEGLVGNIAKSSSRKIFLTIRMKAYKLPAMNLYFPSLDLLMTRVDYWYVALVYMCESARALLHMPTYGALQLL